MSDLQVRGPLYGGTGTPSPFTSDVTGAQRVQDAHGRYAEANRRGSLFQISGAAGAVSAFTGGAAGTPLLAIYNPPNSGKNLEVLFVSLASRVAASAAGTVGFNLWGGPTAAITGTNTPPTNLLSLAASGSAARGFVNTALTGSTAIGLLMPLASYYWATAAGAILSPAIFDVSGLVIVAPGNVVALGGTAALTSATYDFAVIWEEVPALA